MDITAAMVRALREKTGLPMMDCKAALIEAAGDEAKAIDILRKKGIGKIEKMQGRETSQGRVTCHCASGRAGIVELRCETAPVANTDDFINLGKLIARQVAAMDNPTPAALPDQALLDDPSKKVSDAIHDAFNKIRENIQIARVASLHGNVGAYQHHNGQVGVIVQMSADCPSSACVDVCMHIAAMKPPYNTRDQVPAAEVERERQTAAEGAKGKPAEIAEKIIDGKLNRWYGEIVLHDQPFVKEEKHSVGQYLDSVAKGLRVSTFVRYQIGGE